MDKINKALEGRVTNWKFRSALSYLGETKNPRTKRLVRLLADLYQDCGHFNGKMAILVQLAVNEICASEGWYFEWVVRV